MKTKKLSQADVKGIGRQDEDEHYQGLHVLARIIARCHIHIDSESEMNRNADYIEGGPENE